MTDEVNLPIPASSAQPEPEVVKPAEPKAVESDEPARDPNRVYSQDEFDKIVAKVKKNERYRTKKEIEAFYQGRESAQPRQVAEPPKPAPVDEAPTRDKFDSYEAYLEAKSEHTAKRAAAEYRKQYEQEQEQAKAQEAQAKRRTEFQTKLTEKYPDITERAEAIAHIQMPEGMADAITESDFGPDVLNHFADNPEDFERIAALSPSAAIRAIGRLEAGFEAAQTKPEPTLSVVKTPSRAPAPIKPLGGSTVKTDDEPSHDQPEKWAAWRNRQVQKRKAS